MLMQNDKTNSIDDLSLQVNDIPIGDLNEDPPVPIAAKSDLLQNRNEITLWGFSTPYLLYISTPNWYMVWFCLILFFKSMIMNAFISTTISNLEKRYRLSSQETSLIVSMYDIGCLMVVLPISFYGNKGHKPRWVGVGGFIMGLGCFLYAAPHFISGHYESTNIIMKEIHLCNNISQTESKCNEGEQFNQLQNYKYIFYVAQFLIGIGSSPSYTLGFTYIEEVMDNRKSALYVAIVTAIISVGSAVGFGLSAIFLKIYVDVSTPSQYLPQYDKSTWVGAWWIGFVLCGFGQTVFSIPLIMFPKNLSENNDLKKSNLENPMVCTNFLDIMKVIIHISLNIKFVSVCLGTTMTLFAVSGINTYGPKYFETVFGITDSSASLVGGGVSLPSVLLGALVGGFLLHNFDWKIDGIFMFMAVTTLITSPLTLIFLLKCHEPEMVGVSAFYPGTNAVVYNNLTSPCNSQCNCIQSIDNFRPGCSVNINIYFSPCFAGCKSLFKRNNITVFNNCSCINTTVNDIQLTDKSCAANLCYSFYVYTVLLGLLLFISFLRAAISITATMRCVQNHETAVALGLRSIINRLFGSIPGPIVFGTLIDNTCILWGQKCTLVANCIKYGSDSFAYVFTGLLIISTFVTGIFFLIPKFVSLSKCSKRIVS